MKVLTHPYLVGSDGVVYGVLAYRGFGRLYGVASVAKCELIREEGLYMLATTNRSQDFIYTPLLFPAGPWIPEREISKESTLTFAEKPIAKKVYDMKLLIERGSIHQITFTTGTTVLPQSGI